jgi:hypothetical protein
MKAGVKRLFSNRRTYNGRLTIGRSKEGLPLVGFKYRKADDWLDFNSKQAEGIRLVGFKYQKGYDWLDSQFHCSCLESRGVSEKSREIRVKNAGNYLPFISGFRFTTSGSGDVISGRACGCDHFRSRHIR